MTHERIVKPRLHMPLIREKTTSLKAAKKISSKQFMAMLFLLKNTEMASILAIFFWYLDT